MAAITSNLPSVIEHTTHKVCVAVLDTGFRPELVYRTHRGVDWRAWVTLGGNWVDGDSFPLDIDGHGTGVLSILAGSRSDLSGINPCCDVLIHKVDGSGACFRQRNWGEAIQASLDIFALLRCRGVIVLASGAWGLSAELHQAVELAGHANTPLVSIAHNDNAMGARYPGRLSSTCDHVICVGAVDRAGNRLACSENKRGSNYGPEVTVYGPGENVPALNLHGTVEFVSGTSAAAAYIAGITATILQINPALTAGNVRGILEAASVPGGLLPDGRRVRIANANRSYEIAFQSLVQADFMRVLTPVQLL